MTDAEPAATGAVARPRFVLADPSIAHSGGHYLEYAKRVLGAAPAAGLEPVLATNAAFDAEAGEPLPFSVHPVFHFDIWGERPTVGSGGAEGDDLRLRLTYSRMGWLWRAAASADAVGMYTELGGLPPRLFRRLLIAQDLRRRVDVMRRREETAGAGVRRGERERFEAELGRVRLALDEIRRGVPAPLEPESYRAQAARSGAVAEDFARSLADLIDTLGLTGRDHVFMPTMGWHDLAGLPRVLRSRPDSPRFHLVFRRNIFDTYPDGYQRLGFSVHELRVLFARVATDGADRVSYFADTRPLAEQYESIGAEIGVLPIPSPDFGPVRKRRAAAAENPEAPVRLGYFGDARREKGFQHLKPVVERLRAADQLSGFQLRLQSYLPAGPSDVEVLRSLEGLRNDFTIPVAMLEGQLSSEQYAAEFENVDAVLVPYERGPYAARSSGIFAEAAAAGLPCVVPAGTWMAGLMDAWTPAYHRREIADDMVLSSTREPGGSDWRVMTPGEETWLEDAPDGLPISPTARPFAMFRRERAATHAWIRFSRGAGGHGLYTQVFIAPRDRDCAPLWRRRFIVGGSESDEASVLVRLPEDARDIWVSFEPAFRAGGQYMLHDLTVAWVRSERPIARCAGGLTYDPDEPVPELVAALQELRSDLPAHRALAREAAAGFAAEHSAENLLAVLLAARPAAAGRRLLLSR